MAKIPTYRDPTIEDIQQKIVDSQELMSSKNIGFGVIGEKCNRKLWYNINNDETEKFSHETLRIFRNGHRDEAVMAEELRLVDGIELHTHDPNRGNKQYKLDDFDGRFTGRLDGVIRGLKQSPKKWHVWEHKSVKDEKFDKLIQLIIELGEKNALEKWNFVYYCQAQSNMKYSDLDSHYMTVSTPGLRRVTGLRTELDIKFADALSMKAKRIINAKEPPERNKTHECNWCRWKDICLNENPVSAPD